MRPRRARVQLTLVVVQGAGVQQKKWALVHGVHQCRQALAGTETWSAKGAAGTVAPECNGAAGTGLHRNLERIGAAGTGRHRNLECIWPADTGRHRNLECIWPADTLTWSAYRRIRTGDLDLQGLTTMTTNLILSDMSNKASNQQYTNS